jgi:hypothetical protein
MGTTMKPDDLEPPFPPFGQTPPHPEEKAAWGNEVEGPSGDMPREPERFNEAPYPDTEEVLLAEPTADELIQAALDEESQKRLWLRAIIPLLQLRSHDSDPSGRVQLAFDLMHIAACERASRLLRSDLPAEGDLRQAEHR